MTMHWFWRVYYGTIENVRFFFRKNFGKHRKTYRRLGKLQRLVVKKARDCRWWDYCYLLEIERQYLVYMHEGMMSRLAAAEGSERNGRICAIMVALIDIIIGNEFDTDRYVNFNNAERFLSPDGCRFFRDYHDRNVANNELRIAKANVLYNRMREQYMMRLWD